MTFCTTSYVCFVFCEEIRSVQENKGILEYCHCCRVLLNASFLPPPSFMLPHTVISYLNCASFVPHFASSKPHFASSKPHVASSNPQFASSKPHFTSVCLLRTSFYLILPPPYPEIDKSTVGMRSAGSKIKYLG